MLIAVLIFIITITLVIWQPKGLGVVWSAALGAVLAMLMWFFRKELPNAYDINQLERPESAIRDRATFVADGGCCWWAFSSASLWVYRSVPLQRYAQSSSMPLQPGAT